MTSNVGNVGRLCATLDGRFIDLLHASLHFVFCVEAVDQTLHCGVLLLNGLALEYGLFSEHDGPTAQLVVQHRRAKRQIAFLLEERQGGLLKPRLTLTAGSNELNRHSVHCKCHSASNQRSCERPRTQRSLVRVGGRACGV